MQVGQRYARGVLRSSDGKDWKKFFAGGRCRFCCIDTLLSALGGKPLDGNSLRWNRLLALALNVASRFCAGIVHIVIRLVVLQTQVFRDLAAENSKAKREENYQIKCSENAHRPCFSLPRTSWSCAWPPVAVPTVSSQRPVFVNGNLVCRRLPRAYS